MKWMQRLSQTKRKQGNRQGTDELDKTAENCMFLRQAENLRNSLELCYKKAKNCSI
ncbi:hypothetical protein J5TS2_34880 [Brevibacillus halotolerans]|nr:hypothetical protein J5TS2_34880 [Brevibacillus halotolerans]